MVERRYSNDRRVTDRRRTQRSSIDCQIRLLSAAAPSQIVQGSLLDASVSGLRVSNEHAIAAGEKLLIEARRAGRVVCNVTVQVIWTESQPDGRYIIGCESLTDLSPRQLAQLKSVAAESAAVASV